MKALWETASPGKIRCLRSADVLCKRGLSQLKPSKTVRSLKIQMKYLLVLETSLERVLNESGRMVPSFSDSVPQGKPVALYFVIYPANTNSVDPKVTLQLFHDGKEVARKLVTLPEKQFAQVLERLESESVS